MISSRRRTVILLLFVLAVVAVEWLLFGGAQVSTRFPPVRG